MAISGRTLRTQQRAGYKSQSSADFVLIMKLLTGQVMASNSQDKTERKTGSTTYLFLFLVAAWAIVTGIMEIVGAFVLPLGAGREWLLGMAGLASVIFGALLAIWPRAGLVALVWLIDIYALVFGILYIVGYFQTRSLASSLT